MTRYDSTTAAETLADANMFEIDGPIRTHFSATSIQGVPLLSYEDAELDLSFEGDQIIRIQTPLGVLVIVTLKEVVDAARRTFTLVVPAIRVADDEVVEFDTVGIETTDRSVAFVPGGSAGVLQVNRIHQLHGTARSVQP
jgi:hypothetical protein